MNELYPSQRNNQADTSPDGRSSDPSGGLWQRMRAHPFKTFAAVCGGGAVLLLAYVFYLIPATPSLDDLRLARIAQPSEFRSLDGQLLGNFTQTQQERIPLERISPHVIEALIATEDRRFYEHHGIDYGRTAAAAFNTLSGTPQGGSTITQQLARNLFPEEIGRSRNLNRKLKELVTAVKMEQIYSKEQILETYLNTVPFLYNVFGIELAARTYFGKPAAGLDVLESATLVGMLKGTSYYNPVINPERALKRRNVVLQQMVKSQKLSDAEYQGLSAKPLQVRFSRQMEQFALAPHFLTQVRNRLIEWAGKNNYDLNSDGLVVTTTLDLSLQKAAMRAVERQANLLQNIADVEWSRAGVGAVSYSGAAYQQIRKKIEPFQYFWNTRGALLDDFIRESPEYKAAVEKGETASAALIRLKSDANFLKRLRAAKTRLETGFVALDPASGEVRAWVGSRDYQRDQFDHVAQAARQPGSTFKPIVYGAALEQGFSPYRQYLDGPVEIRAGDGSMWRPGDMSGASGMEMSLRDGLVYSKNTITAQVMQDVGVPSIVKLARAVGVRQSRLDPVPSLALGTSPVTLLEMASAYATIAQEGEYHRPLLIKRIADRNGKVLAEFGDQGQPAMSRHSAIQLIDMMRGVVNEGTGTAVKTRFGITADIAGKTGTTQNNTDGWFILMHPNLVAGAWVGFNDTRVTMRSNYWGQGGHNAILVVGDFFREALKSKQIDASAQFSRPEHPGPREYMRADQEEDWSERMEREPHSSDGAPDYDRADRPPAEITIYGRKVIITKTPEDVEHLMRAMGRDPVSGIRIDTERQPPPEANPQ